jgi:hypothetical protein
VKFFLQFPSQSSKDSRIQMGPIKTQMKDTKGTTCNTQGKLQGKEKGQEGKPKQEEPPQAKP